MKNLAVLLTLLMVIPSCKKQEITQLNRSNSYSNPTYRLGPNDHPELRFDFNVPTTSNIWLNSGNMTNTNISPIDTLCCDGIPTQEFFYHYGSLTNGSYYVEAYADTLIDYGIEFANIDVSGYSFLNPCPQGMNVNYVGNNCITKGVINWDGQLIHIKGCHYVSMKLKIFPNIADTLYIQIFRGQPVVMNTIKTWQ